MDEIITEERRDRLKGFFVQVADRNVLTNMDAMMIIEILTEACKRKKASLYEELMTEMIEGSDEE